jgi:hypothetical protein
MATDKESHMSNLEWTHTHGWFEVDHLPGHVPGYWDGNPAHNPKIEKEDAIRWLNESADCAARVDGEGNLIVNFMDDSNPVDFPPQDIPTEHGRKVLYDLSQWIWGIAEPLKKAEFKIFMDTNKAVGYTSFNTIGGWHAPKYTRQQLEKYMTMAGTNLKMTWWIEDETTFLITHQDEDMTWRLHPIRFNTVEGVLDLYDTQVMEWEWMLINQIIVAPKTEMASILPDGDHGTSFKMLGDSADIQVGMLTIHIERHDDRTETYFFLAGHEDRKHLTSVTIMDDHLLDEEAEYRREQAHEDAD